MASSTVPEDPSGKSNNSTINNSNSGSSSSSSSTSSSTSSSNSNNNNNNNNNANNANNNSSLNAEDRNRNFRIHYYAKVGYRGIEEKSLEYILEQVPVDKLRLHQFVTRCTLPFLFREKVWLLLLDVITSRKQDYILNEQQRIAFYLKRALTTLLDVPLTSISPDQQLVMMYLLDTGNFDGNGTSDLLNLSAKQPLINIASVITFADPQPQFKYEYTIFREIIKLIASVDLDEMVSRILIDLANTCTAVSNDNQNSQFLLSLNATQSLNANHDDSLNHHNNYNCLPLREMLESCFATYIPYACVIKVWDKVVTGNVSKVMTSFTRELLLAHKEKYTSLEQVIQVLQNFSPEKSEKVFFKVCQPEG